MADFGFAKLAAKDPDTSHVSTQIKGTVGYLDPDYLRTNQLTDKSDVYSFGVLLVEMMTGRQPIESKRPSLERVTIRWVSILSSQKYYKYYLVIFWSSLICIKMCQIFQVSNELVTA